jgi:sugar/nucleoside kinase (ribokinase family)
MKHCGLFVGLTTLDLIYGVSHLPQANEKQVADCLEISAGGPATNAAVTFQHLGNRAVLFSAVGNHPLSELVRTDLESQQVELKDLCPKHDDPLPISSILITHSTGDRTIISRNAVNLQVKAESTSVRPMVDTCLETADIVLIDGHQLEVSLDVAQKACLKGIPVVLDGGSWKPGLERLLPWIDYAICSSDFFPPNCTTSVEGMQYLSQKVGIHTTNRATPFGIAITAGEQPVQYLYEGQTGEVIVPPIQAIDTLGAGDIFHGAFCHAILDGSFVSSIRRAIEIASVACQSFGTRQWLNSFRSDTHSSKV